ncbi:unnamed protein product [Ixodes pacificus]
MYLYALDYEYIYNNKTGKSRMAIYGKSYPNFQPCVIYVNWSAYVYVAVSESSIYRGDPCHLDINFVQNNIVDARIQGFKASSKSVSDVKYEVVSKCNGYGYHNDEETFIRVRIADPKVLRSLVRSMPIGTTFSGQIDSIIQFMVDIKATSWLQFDNAKTVRSSGESTCYSTCTEEYNVWDVKQVRPVPDETVFNETLASKMFLLHWDFENEELVIKKLLRYMYDNATCIEDVINDSDIRPLAHFGPTRYNLVLTKGPWIGGTPIKTRVSWLSTCVVEDNQLKNSIYYVDLETNVVMCTFAQLLYEQGYRKTSFSSVQALRKIYADNFDFDNFGLVAQLSVPQITTMCFDIECISDDDANFPMAKAGDPIIQIACVTVRDMCRTKLEDYSKPNVNICKTIFTIGSCSDIPGVEVVCCTNESELLLEFNNYIAKRNPDVITGYNIIGFDFPYIMHRMAMLKINQTFSRRKWSRWSCYTKKPTGQIEFFKPPSNEELADPDWKARVYKEGGGRSWTDEIALTTPSRVIIDMYKVIQAGQFKLRRETLDAVSSHFLGGETKENVKYKDMFRLYKGTADDRKKIATYCVQDTMLPLKLMTKLSTMVSTIQFAKVNMIPLRYVHGKGQQIRAFSLILHEARDRNMIFPSFIPFKQDEAFQGATVVEPTTGLYRSPVMTLDFASLYPSIIIAYNLCFTTVKLQLSVAEMVYHYKPKRPSEVLEYSKPKKMPAKKKFKTIHGQRRIDDFDVKKQNANIATGGGGSSKSFDNDGEDEFLEEEIISPTGDRFVTKNVRLGIMPKVIVKLLDARREIRRQIAKEDDPFVKMLLNNQQLAIKCTANAMYGFTGALERGMLSCVYVSRSITAFGRKLINRTKLYVDQFQKEFRDGDRNIGELPHGLEVIYGDTDSVMVKTPADTSVQTALKWGEQLAKWINKHYIRPVELEFEKVYMPYILFTKKRYAGRMFVDMNTPPKIDCKGLENVRRDTCKYVSEVVSECINLIVERNDLESAVLYAKESAFQLSTKSVPIDKLLMTRALSRKEYAVSMPHVEVVKKIAQRAPGTEPRGGERVQFVMKTFTPFQTHCLKDAQKISNNKVKAAHRAEDPSYLLNSTDEEIDYQHYLHMLKPPLLRIFTVALNCSESEATRRIFGKCDSIGYHPSLEVSAPLSKFVVRKKRCTTCRRLLENGAVDANECDACSVKECGDGNVQNGVDDGIRTHARRVLDFLNICKQCVGVTRACDISCTNQDCKYFFTRKEAARTLKIKYENVKHDKCDPVNCENECIIKMSRLELKDMLEW